MGNPWGPPQLIALDIDGTILGGFRSPVSQRVAAGVRNAVAGGAHVVLATGRPMITTVPVLTELGLTAGNALCSNGAIRMDVASGEVVSAHLFDARPVVEWLRVLLPDVVFAVEQPGEENLITGQFLGSDATWPDRLVDHETLVANPVTRLTAWWHEHTSDELQDRLSAAGFNGVSYSVDPVAPCLVAVPNGISKGFALEQLRLELDVQAELTLAVGDGSNDVEMLRWAALGVAMGHAPDIVKAAAHEICGTIDDDGLAAVLERWY